MIIEVNETQRSLIIFDMGNKFYDHLWNSILLVIQINKWIGRFCFIFSIFASAPQNNIFKRGVSRSFLFKMRRNDEKICFILNKYCLLLAVENNSIMSTTCSIRNSIFKRTDMKKKTWNIKCEHFIILSVLAIGSNYYFLGWILI